MGSTVQESGSRSRPLDLDFRLPSSLPPTLTLAYAQIACSQLFQQKKSELNFKIRQRQQKLKNFHCAEGAPLCRSLPFIHTLTLSLSLTHTRIPSLLPRGILLPLLHLAGMSECMDDSLGHPGYKGIVYGQRKTREMRKICIARSGIASSPSHTPHTPG